MLAELGSLGSYFQCLVFNPQDRLPLADGFPRRSLGNGGKLGADGTARARRGNWSSGLFS